MSESPLLPNSEEMFEEEEGGLLGMKGWQFWGLAVLAGSVFYFVVGGETSVTLEGNVGFAVGSAVGSMLPALLVLLVAKLVNRSRSDRQQRVLFLIVWPLTVLFLLLGQVSALESRVEANQGGDGPSIEWEVQSLAGGKFSLETPEEMVAMPLDIPEVYREMLVSVESYKMEMSPPLFAVTAGYTTYAEGVELSLEGAAQGAVARLGQVEEITGPSYRTAPTSLSGHPGLLFSGTLDNSGAAIEFRGIVLDDSPSSLVIMTMGREDDLQTVGWASRVIESVRVRGI